MSSVFHMMMVRNEEDTSMTNQTNTTMQPTQFQEWELTPHDHETIDTYKTSSGYSVTVTTVNHRNCSHVHIVVSDESAFVDACCGHFDGFSHRTACASFVDDYLKSSELEFICKCFDALCVEI